MSNYPGPYKLLAYNAASETETESQTGTGESETESQTGATDTETGTTETETTETGSETESESQSETASSETTTPGSSSDNASASTDSKATESQTTAETGSNTQQDVSYKASGVFKKIGDRVQYNVDVPIKGLPSFITQEMIVGALKSQDEYGYPASVTIALSSFKIAFKSDDFPAFGFPIIAVFIPSFIIFPLSKDFSSFSNLSPTLFSIFFIYPQHFFSVGANRFVLSAQH